MTTQTLPHSADDDTQQVARPAGLGGLAGTARRLAEMDLDPPSGPVPADVLAYFERAVAGEARRRRQAPLAAASPLIARTARTPAPAFAGAGRRKG
jgi:hypothetical protein